MASGSEGNYMPPGWSAVEVHPCSAQPGEFAVKMLPAPGSLGTTPGIDGCTSPSMREAFEDDYRIGVSCSQNRCADAGHGVTQTGVCGYHLSAARRG